MSDELLCRTNGATCGGCCWNADLERSFLVPRLRRQRRLFDRLVPRLGRGRLLLYELAARRGLDLVLGPLLRLPWVGERVRSWYERRVICAFVAFDNGVVEEGAEKSVGCLLHPTRWQGVDARPLAFRWLAGFRCGPADYLCTGARNFAAAPADRRPQMLRWLDGLDWFEYSRKAPLLPVLDDE